jgi:hypothetical protein
MPIGLKGNTDGSGAVQIGGSDAISISTGLNTTFAGTITATGTVAGTTGTLYPLVSGTSVSATGTAVDFTGIPSWVKRITVMFSGVSTNGTALVLVQLGSSTFTTSGYNSIGTGITGSSVSSVTNNSSGFGVGNEGGTAASSRVGTFILTNITGNVWAAMFQYAFSDTGRALFGSGNVTLSGTLDRVRITTSTGTDTFDAGSINILYE